MFLKIVIVNLFLLVLLRHPHGLSVRRATQPSLTFYTACVSQCLPHANRKQERVHAALAVVRRRGAPQLFLTVCGHDAARAIRGRGG